jgi:ABC-type amino acid transport substrate-binding protein
MIIPEYFRVMTLRRTAVALLAMAILLATHLPVTAQEIEAVPSLTPDEQHWLLQRHETIRLGITIIPPQILRGKNGYEGLSLDYIHLLEHKLGCRFTLVPYDTWNDVIQAAKTRDIDMIFAAQRTPERLEYLAFTDSYIDLQNVIVVRNDHAGGATSLKDMHGWTVAASKGSAVHEFLRKEHPELIIRPVENEVSGLTKVSFGEIDAMVVEPARASYYIEKEGLTNLRVTGEAGLLYQLRFAVRNDWPELCSILDKGLACLSDDERRRINRRWIIVGNGACSNAGSSGSPWSSSWDWRCPPPWPYGSGPGPCA